MKTTNKLFSLLIMSIFAIVSCSKGSSKYDSITYIQPKSEVSQETERANDIESLGVLLRSEATNIALANLLLKMIPTEEKAVIKSLLEGLSHEEAQKIIENVASQNKGIRESYLFHGQRYQDNKDFLANVMKAETATGDLSLTTQLKVSVFAYVKNKSLREVVSAYDSRANELAKDLAMDVAMAMANSKGSNEIESSMRTTPQDEMIEKIKKAKPFIEKVDLYFRSSDLNEKEQFTLLLSVAVAGGVYELLQQNKSFVKILEKGKLIVRDIKEIQAKANEAAMLLSALNTHLDHTAKDIGDFTAGVRDSYRDLNRMFQRAKYPAPGTEKIELAKIKEFLTQKVIKGKDIKADGTNASILSQQYQINANIYKSSIAACNVADNLSNIVATTARLGDLLGVKPSKDLQKVIDGAQKVGRGAILIKAAITGWITGGPLGAMTALSSGPLGSLLASGGGGDSAKLGEISGKLDIIIANQRRMLQMQAETMKMIKDLALMVDQYHQEEMRALAAIRDISIINQEIEKSKLYENISSCESMIQYQLASVWSNLDLKNESFNSINHLKLLSQTFYSRIIDRNSLLWAINSLEEERFKTCQKGIVEAFGGRTGSENPLRAIFMSDEKNNLLDFERNIYRPLLTSLQNVAEVSNLNSIPLHLPAQDVWAQKYKAAYVDHARDLTPFGNQVYDFEHLISTKALERYLSSLLILYPILEVDKDIWSRSLKEIIGLYLDTSISKENLNTRSHYFLSNALKLTQTAIAQEAIMSGEPLLHKLYEKGSFILSSSDCRPEDLVCTARGNSLLIKNLLTYTLIAQKSVTNDLLGRYEEAYKNDDVALLADLLKSNLSAKDFSVEKEGVDQGIFILLDSKDSDNRPVRISVKLPSPKQLQEGKILYSENMPRLLIMQDLILESLEKVTPVDRGRVEDLLKVLVTSSAI